MGTPARCVEHPAYKGEQRPAITCSGCWIYHSELLANQLSSALRDNELLIDQLTSCHKALRRVQANQEFIA